MDATGCSWGWSSLSPCPDLVLVYSFLKKKNQTFVLDPCALPAWCHLWAAVWSVWALSGPYPASPFCWAPVSQTFGTGAVCTLSLPFDLLLSYPWSVWAGHSLSLSPNGHDSFGQSQMACVLGKMVLWDSQKINFALVSFMAFCLSVCFSTLLWHLQFWCLSVFYGSHRDLRDPPHSQESPF